MGYGLEDSIRGIVKDIDPRFDCKFNRDRAAYEITQTGPFGNTNIFGVLPWDGVTKEFFDNMRKAVFINRNGDVMRDIEESNYKAEVRKAVKQEEDIDYLLKTTMPTMSRAFREL